MTCLGAHKGNQAVVLLNLLELLLPGLLGAVLGGGGAGDAMLLLLEERAAQKGSYDARWS